MAVLALGSLLPFFGPHPVWGWPAAALLPGLLLARALPPAPSRLIWLARTLLVGPAVSGLIATLLELAHLRAAWPWAVTIFNVVTVALLLALDRRRPAGSGGSTGGDETLPFARATDTLSSAGADNSPRPVPADAALKAAAWIGIALVVFVLLPEIVRPWIRQRADSWFHVAVVEEIQRTGIPPQDPYFAGFRLQYMWFYHMILLALHESTGLPVFWVMPILNALALWSFCLLAANAVIALGGSRRAAAWGAALVPLGLSALFWVVFPYRILRGLIGQVHGTAALEQSFRLSPLDVGTTRHFMSEFNSVPFFLNKFMVGTAYSLGLAFLLIYITALVRFAAGGRRRYLVTAGVTAFAMLLIHPVVGYTAVAVSGLTGIVLWAMGRRRGGLAIAEVLMWGAVVLLAFAAAAPYLRSVTPPPNPDAPRIPLHLNINDAIGITVGCLLAILVAIRPLVHLWQTRTRWGRLFVVWSLMTILFGFTIWLPAGNATDKFSFLIYIPLALAGATWVAEKWRGRRGAVIALLVLVPVNLIGYAGYWGEADQRERSPESAALYQWISAQTPRDAVMVENRERTGVLVRGPRRLYWGREVYAESWQYDPASMDRRRAVIRELFTPGAPVDAATMRDLGTVGASVYVIVRSEDFTSADDFHKLDRYPALFQLAHDAPGFRIYKFTG